MSTKRASLSSGLQENSAEVIDELDVAIIRVLQRKGRATNEEVGDAVDLSPSAASRRIHHLETQGVITGYQAIIESKALGADITVRFTYSPLQRRHFLSSDGGRVRLHVASQGGWNYRFVNGFTRRSYLGFLASDGSTRVLLYVT